MKLNNILIDKDQLNLDAVYNWEKKLYESNQIIGDLENQINYQNNEFDLIAKDFEDKIFNLEEDVKKSNQIISNQESIITQLELRLIGNKNFNNNNEKIPPTNVRILNLKQMHPHNGDVVSYANNNGPHPNNQNDLDNMDVVSSAPNRKINISHNNPNDLVNNDIVSSAPNRDFLINNQNDLGNNDIVSSAPNRKLNTISNNQNNLDNNDIVSSAPNREIFNKNQNNIPINNQNNIPINNQNNNPNNNQNNIPNINQNNLPKNNIPINIQNNIPNNNQNNIANNIVSSDPILNFSPKNNNMNNEIASSAPVRNSPKNNLDDNKNINQIISVSPNKNPDVNKDENFLSSGPVREKKPLYGVIKKNNNEKILPNLNVNIGNNENVFLKNQLLEKGRKNKKIF